MTTSHKPRFLIALAVLLLLVGNEARGGPPEPATLGIDEIIQGIEGNHKLWLEQKSWMVRYTHTRERVAPPPGEMVEFPDVELVNARRGKALAIYHSQPLTVDRGKKTENWLLWDGTAYTERNGLQARIQTRPSRTSSPTSGTR